MNRTMKQSARYRFNSLGLILILTAAIFAMGERVTLGQNTTTPQTPAGTQVLMRIAFTSKRDGHSQIYAI